MGGDLDLSITNVLDLDLVAEVTNTVIDLDLVLKEFLEGGDVEDLVAGWLGSVDDVLFARSQLQFLAQLQERCVNTFVVTLACLPLVPLVDFYQMIISLLYHASTNSP